MLDLGPQAAAIMAIKTPSGNKESCKSNPTPAHAHMLAVIELHLNNLMSHCISSAIIHYHHLSEKTDFQKGTKDWAIARANEEVDLCSIFAFAFYGMEKTENEPKLISASKIYTDTLSCCLDLSASVQRVCYNPSRIGCDQKIKPCCVCMCVDAICEYVCLLNSYA